MKIFACPGWVDLVILFVLYMFLQGGSDVAHMAVPAAVGPIRYLCSLIFLKRVYLMARNGFIYQTLLVIILVVFLSSSEFEDRLARIWAVYLLVAFIVEMICSFFIGRKFVAFLKPLLSDRHR